MTEQSTNPASTESVPDVRSLATIIDREYDAANLFGHGSVPAPEALARVIANEWSQAPATHPMAGDAYEFIYYRGWFGPTARRRCPHSDLIVITADRLFCRGCRRAVAGDASLAVIRYDELRLNHPAS